MIHVIGIDEDFEFSALLWFVVGRLYKIRNAMILSYGHFAIRIFDVERLEQAFQVEDPNLGHPV